MKQWRGPHRASNPPRPESQITSVKSDSLSWTVEEQRAIDRALEEVWKPVIAGASPPADMSATTVAELASGLAKRFREEGRPYVVTHPARLYMAHPKWPKSPSEPIDERTTYYCERDIVRHARLWRDAALTKGLVQFEVPTDAGLYHPKDRHRWPQPMLSSHEESGGATSADRDTSAGQVSGTQSATAAAGTNDRQGTASAGKSAATPLPALPESEGAGSRGSGRACGKRSATR